MPSRSAPRQIAGRTARKECLGVMVDGRKFIEEIAGHLHLAEAIEEHRQRQIHHRDAFFVALIQLDRRIALLNRRIDEHQLIAAAEPVILREAQHLLALLRREAQLACLGKRIDVREAQEHVGLRRGHRPKFADILRAEHPLRLETSCRFAGQILIVAHAVVRILGEILDRHARRRDIVRLDAERLFDDLIALLSGRLTSARDQLVGCGRILLAR